MQGVVSPLRKGVVGEYYTGYLEGRCIGRVVIAESAIAYEVENSELYEPLEIAAVGIAKYIDGFYDFLDDRIIREVEVPGAIDEDRRRHDEMINHILYGNWNE